MTPIPKQQDRLDNAFDRIEETILPCICMMLEALLEASEAFPEARRRFLVAELQTLSSELEELTKTVEGSNPNLLEPGEYRTRSVA
ncbi:MAG: hypothetical protein ABIR63_02045 [Sphingomicrobium sp.]